jgi:hypothetical protein
MSAAVTTNKRKPFYQTSSYDDMDVPDHETNRRRLADWHDHAHGLSLWTHCSYEPCKLLTDEFRRTN